MKSAVAFLLCSFFILGCRDQARHDARSKVDSGKCPLSINEERKIVIAVGKMTADKGLKIFSDAVTFTPEELDSISLKLHLVDSLKLYLQDSSKPTLLPFQLPCVDYENFNGVIAVDESNYAIKRIIALIEKTGTVWINSGKESVRLEPVETFAVKEGKWICTFKNDSLEAQISGVLTDKSSTHLAGAGNLVLKQNGRIITEETIYLLWKPVRSRG